MLFLLISFCTCKKQRSKIRVPATSEYEKGETLINVPGNSSPGLNKYDNAIKYYGLALQFASSGELSIMCLNPDENSKRYSSRYQSLQKGEQTSLGAAKNQFALTQFEAEKNKTDILRLQKENTEKEYQVISLVLIILILVTATVIIIILQRKRKQKILQKAENSIRESRLETSKKVHDVVANGLYQIMVRVQHDHNLDIFLFLDEIETLYEKSRDILYEQPVKNSIDFSKEVKQLLVSFSTPDIKVLVTGNERELWKCVAENVKYELKHVLQELMINMRKHSRAKNVVIKFELKNKHLLIQYTDDGVGLNPQFSKRNGLTNTENRIGGIGGSVIFDTHNAKGLRICIYVPAV